MVFHLLVERQMRRLRNQNKGKFEATARAIVA